KIYKFNCDTRVQELFIDIAGDGEGWKLYGCAMGIHPVTDELYMALYHEFSIPTYITRRYSVTGEKVRDYEMIMNYWFPSLPLFPMNQNESSVEDINNDTCNYGNIYNLQGCQVKTNVEFGNWENLNSGIYIWKSANKTHKFMIP
ncbi:MAG: DUF5074 domain-containing protein, partial [Muribaculaceae bacterium]|nr:DUF5074 domain-containing protein [Muribaculaceae bacterium]